MFGTDLESAYYQTNNFNNMPKSTPIHKPSSTTEVHQYQPSPEYATQPSHQQQPKIHHPPPPINGSSPTPPAIAIYEDNPFSTSLIDQQINNEYLIQQIQAELAKEKKSAKGDAVATTNNDSIFDRFASKKKDVFKLLNISLSVLLAISLHYVMGDIIKVYLRNNDFTYNKEVFVKTMYPASVLLILWSLKVFNK